MKGRFIMKINNLSTDSLIDRLTITQNFEKQIIRVLYSRYGSKISNIIRDVYKEYGYPHNSSLISAKNRSQKWVEEQIELSQIRLHSIILDIIQIFGNDAAISIKHAFENYGMLLGKRMKKKNIDEINAQKIFHYMLRLSPFPLCITNRNEIVRSSPDYVLWYCFSSLHPIRYYNVDSIFIDMFQHFCNSWIEGFCSGANPEYGFSSKKIKHKNNMQYKNRIYKKQLLLHQELSDENRKENLLS